MYGGTSASTQAFGGLLTLMVQTQGTGYGFGNINPTLYNLAANPTNYAAVFHDITTGNNIVPCNPSLQGAPDPGCVNGETGYTAQTGYDMTTGLGSIDGEALYTALFGACAGAAATTTTLDATQSGRTERVDVADGDGDLDDAGNDHGNRDVHAGLDDPGADGGYRRLGDAATWR